MANVEWKSVLQDRAGNVPPLLSEMIANETGKTPATADDAGELVRLLQTAAPEARRDLMVRHFVAALAAVIHQPLSRIDPAESLSRFGLDSLMAIEFKDAIEKALGLAVPLEILLENPNILDLVDRILTLWAGTEAGGASAPSTEAESFLPDFLRFEEPGRSAGQGAGEPAEPERNGQS